MAERVQNFARWSTRSVNAEKEKNGYPWEEWADGTIWRIHAGADYVIKSSSMKAKLYQQGKRMGIRVRVVVDTHTDPENITFQFLR